MNEVIFDFFIGTTLSSVPIFVLTKYYFENNLTLKNYDYKSAVIYMPIQMGFINMILFLIMRNFLPNTTNNPLFIGTIFSIILSMLSSPISFNIIPNEVIKMNNSNLFHIYSIVVFTIIYFILLNIKKNFKCF